MSSEHTLKKLLPEHFTLRQFLLMNLGLLLVASGIYLFKTPNHFVTGGVSGISITITGLLPGIGVGPLMVAVNVVLMIVGFIFLGKDFGWKSLYGSYALSGMVWLLEGFHHMAGPLTNDPLLELFFAILLPGVGSALVFNQNASTGGTDIIAKILQKRTSVNVGTALLMSDFVIAGCGGAVFGVKVGLYSILGLILKAFIIDVMIENLNTHKKMEIISSQPHEVCEFILHELGRGATLYPAKGAFSGRDWTVVHTVVTRRQAFLIRGYLKHIDPKAFVTITTSHEIIGKGFRSPES